MSRKRARIMNKINKIKNTSRKSKLIGIAAFVVVFGGIGGLIIHRSNAAAGLCSTTDVIGTSTIAVTAPETATYRLWVRMQVPETTNTNNLNGVRLELAGSSNQCFTVTTANANAVNQWQWINSDAQAVSTAHITAQLPAGNYSAKILGLKAGVRVDKVLLLKSDNTCTPDNVFGANRNPGDNCTTSAPTVSMTADANPITSGTGTTIRWTTTNAASCTGSGAWGNNTRATSGSFGTGNLSANQTYNLSCTGTGGTGTGSITVNVTAPPAPTVFLNANQTTVVSGSATTINWSSTNATNCAATGGSNGWANANRATSGSFGTGNLSANQTYNLSCTGPGGTAAATPVTVTVTATPPPNDTANPIVNMNFDNFSSPTGETNRLVNNVKSVVWRPTAEDDSGNYTLVLRVNGQPISLTGGAYIFGGGTTATTGNGDYELAATATDGAGKVTTRTLTIRLRHPDIDRSGIIDSGDFGLLLRSWNQSSSRLDLDTDNTISSGDFGILLRRWNSTQ